MTNHTPPVPDAVTDGKTTPSATQAKMLCISRDGDGKPKIVSSNRINSVQSTQPSEVDLVLIPPPSDFMDEPGAPAQPKNIKDLYQSSVISRTKPVVTVEELRQRASVKRTSVCLPVAQGDPNMAPPVSPSVTQPSLINSGHQMEPTPDTVDSRSPPAVAPKPKKLPSNIILNSHKAPASSDGSGGHPVPTSSDRVLLDPQKVRIEALRKLGLLKNEDDVLGPALSPKNSPQTRRSWPTPPSPVSQSSTHTPLMPSSTCINSLLPAAAPLQSHVAVSPSANCSAPVVQYSPDILPAPAAFSDPIEPLLTDNKLSAVEDVSEAKFSTRLNTPPVTPPALTKHLTPPKIRDVKSASLERSYLGLNTYMIDQDSSKASQGVSGNESPSQLRISRPRPASLGSRREFADAQGESLQTGYASVKESLPAHTAIQHSGDSQKLPRSQGISVLICPRAENGEDRRKALKKLGLLRD